MKYKLIILTLTMLAILVPAALAVCEFKLESKNTADFLNEIPSLNAQLQKCPIVLDTAAKLIFGKNQNVQLNIARNDNTTSTALFTITSGALNSASIGAGKTGYDMFISECTLDAILKADSLYGSFTYFYSKGDIKIVPKGIWNKIKFTIAKWFGGGAIKKAATPVTSECFQEKSARAPSSPGGVQVQNDSGTATPPSSPGGMRVQNDTGTGTAPSSPGGLIFGDEPPVKKAIGEQCASSIECASNYCDDVSHVCKNQTLMVIGYVAPQLVLVGVVPFNFTGIAGSDVGTTPLGEQCSQSADCVSANCDSMSHVCVQGNKGLGSSCASGFECRSKNCKAGVCVQGTLARHYSCNANEQCLSNFCSPEDSQCGAGIVPTGAACSNNAECVSEFCAREICTQGGKMEGDACTNPDQCRSGRCGSASHPGVCLKQLFSLDFGADCERTNEEGMLYNYHPGVAGPYDVSNYAKSECKSGRCSATSHKCINGMRDPGQTCSVNDVCYSMHCVGGYCVQGIRTDEICTGPSQCFTRQCWGAGGEWGACQPPARNLNLQDPCTVDAQCISRNCASCPVISQLCNDQTKKCRLGTEATNKNIFSDDPNDYKDDQIQLDQGFTTTQLGLTVQLLDVTESSVQGPGHAKFSATAAPGSTPTEFTLDTMECWAVNSVSVCLDNVETFTQPKNALIRTYRTVTDPSQCASNNVMCLRFSDQSQNNCQIKVCIQGTIMRGQNACPTWLPCLYGCEDRCENEGCDWGMMGSGTGTCY
jgi:hypothetical protein